MSVTRTTRCRGIWGAITLAVLLTCAPARDARAHGVWGHVHVTGWAIENLSPGELRDFFAEPEVLNAALFGAAFTDSGYWLQSGPHRDAARSYTEHTHWEPFVQDYIEWILANDPPPFETLESRKRVAFLMGCAAHGLQDEIFDSLFLEQIAEHDGAGQDEADPGSDGFLALDGHLRFAPQEYIPMELLLELYDPLGQQVTEETIRAGVDFMTFVYLDPVRGERLASSLGEEYAEALSWTRDHYLDQDIPGSLRAEIDPTIAYLEAIWDRLHSRHAERGVVIHAYPATPRRLRAHTPGTADAWVTFVFQQGVQTSAAPTSWVDEQERAIAYTQRGTRWGGPDGWARLARLMPEQQLAPGGWYTTRVEANVPLIDGSMSARAFEHRFQVSCIDEADEACPELALDEYELEPELEDMGLDMSGEGEPDMADMGTPGRDMAFVVEDMAVGDKEDHSSVDMPAAMSHTEPDGEGEGGGGCGCATPGRAPSTGLWGLFSLALFFVRRQRVCLR